MEREKFLRPPEAAELLRNRFGYGSPKTLAKYRTLGDGPVYFKHGRMIVYREEDLLAWAMARLGPPRHSTSDNSRAA